MSKRKKKKKNHKDESQDSSVIEEQAVSAESEEIAEESDIVEDETVSLVAKLKVELVSSQDQLLRARADFDNFRKRKAREMEQVRKTAAELLIRDILPAIDNLNLTLVHVEDADSNLATGVTMVLKQLMDTLADRGLSPIETIGQPFDPNIHEAMTTMPSDDIKADHIVQEFQKGYTLRDSILRPAKVVISSGKAEVDPESDDTVEEPATAE